MNRLSGTKVAEAVLTETKERAGKLPRAPKLVFLRVGANEADVWYETSASKTLAKAGIETDSVALRPNVTEKTFLRTLRALNRDDSVDGILVMMPLPESISVRSVSETIAPEKDMDGISVENMARLYAGQEGIVPCTAEAVVRLLKHHEITIAGKHAVVIGRSPVVGRPVASLLLREDATVTVCHTKTADLPAVAKHADILVSAVGKPRFVTDSFVREGAVVVDVGTSADTDGKIYGDVDGSVSEKASWMSFVTGGIGTVTTAILALHTVEAAEKRLK